MAKTSYFTAITAKASTTAKKKITYKRQNDYIKCSHCSQVIDQENDYFILNLHWKIKKGPDVKNFCSLNCLNKWAK
ncbi:hypothetical protein KY325_04905 [Candidatus Woesearchaeota archaeon]|nr:hypothetical protein [Candidatus Woesearchaeota archaeon]MBW3018473.1 hypothetical protein [Candidatus Woesearchaeota archaeon]